jgi:hypothetical protein
MNTIWGFAVPDGGIAMVAPLRLKLLKLSLADKQLGRHPL